MNITGVVIAKAIIIGNLNIIYIVIYMIGINIHIIDKYLYLLLQYLIPIMPIINSDIIPDNNKFMDCEFLQKIPKL